MIAIIPSKSYSSRWKNKNIKIFNKKPLIQYTIDAALKSKLIKRIVVSTDSLKIARISKKLGAEVPFLRPKKYSRTNSTLKEVCIHAINFLEKKEKKAIESIIVLQPTSPLRNSKDIDKAIRLFKKNNVKYFTSFTKTKPFEWLYNLKKNKNFFQISKTKIKNSQNLKQTFILNGAIYIFKKKFLYNKKSSYSKLKGLLMPRSRSVDIDDINDFNYAEYLIKNKRNV